MGSFVAPVQTVGDIAVDEVGTLAAVGSDSRDGRALWIGRLTPSLSAIWDHTIEHERRVHAKGVAFAENGDILATGEHRALWVRRWSPTGETRWVTQYDKVFGEPLRGTRIATGSGSAIVVARVYTREGSNGTSVLEFDGDGHELARTEVVPAGMSGEVFRGLVIDQGHAWVAGTRGDDAFVGHVPLGGGVLTWSSLAHGPEAVAGPLAVTVGGELVIAGANSRDARWVQKRTKGGTSAGVPTRSQLWRWDHELTLMDLKIDQAGNIVVCGLHRGSEESDARGVVVKLDAEGTPVWTAEAGDHSDGSLVRQYNAVAVDDLGFVYAGGSTADHRGIITKLAP